MVRNEGHISNKNTKKKKQFGRYENKWLKYFAQLNSNKNRKKKQQQSDDNID